MKLTLKNFRCHRDATFELPDRGLTLISGDSGAGKSTILNAIYFVLYGKIRRPYSHGATTCSVTLDDPRTKLKVTRTCKPNRLIVLYDGVEFEDESAQGVIDQVFGLNAEEYQFSSYFDQKRHSSVLSMTPSEQLQFIELIAFVNNDHESTKQQIHDHAKYFEDKQRELQAQIKLLDKQVKEREDEFTKTKSSLSKFSEGERNIDIEAVRETYSNHMNELRSVQKALKKSRSELAELREAESEKRRIEEEQAKVQLQLNHFLSLRSNLSNVMSEDDIEALALEAEEARKYMQSVRDAQESNKLEEEFNELKSEHLANVSAKIDDLKSSLLDEKEFAEISSKLENYDAERKKFEAEERAREEEEQKRKEATKLIASAKKSVIEQFKPHASKTKTTALIKKFLEATISKLDDEYNNLNEQLAIIECEHLQCPKCSAHLLQDDEGLVELTQDEIEFREKNADNAKNIEKLLDEAEQKRDSAVELLKTIDENETLSAKKSSTSKKKKTASNVMTLKEFQSLSVRVSEQKDIRESIANYELELKKETLPKSLTKMLEKIREKRMGVSTDVIQSAQTLNIDDIEKRCRELESNVEEAWRVRGEYSSLSREIRTREQLLNGTQKKFLKSVKTGKSSADVEAEICEYERVMTKLSETIEDLQKHMEVVEAYSNCQRVERELNNLKSSKRDTEEREKNITIRLQGAYGLEKAARDAEFIALEKTIASINEHAKIYLEQMFEDEISARLAIKSHTKAGKISAKPTIRISIDYNGNHYDDIEELSGGERQRCDLSFLLAVNDMLGSNMILLDECLNNLNGEMNVEVLTFLRDLCGDKQVLVVSHEAVTGVFDNIVQL